MTPYSLDKPVVLAPTRLPPLWLTVPLWLGSTVLVTVVFWALWQSNGHFRAETRAHWWPVFLPAILVALAPLVVREIVLHLLTRGFRCTVRRFLLDICADGHAKVTCEATFAQATDGRAELVACSSGSETEKLEVLASADVADAGPVLLEGQLNPSRVYTRLLVQTRCGGHRCLFEVHRTGWCWNRNE